MRINLTKQILVLVIAITACVSASAQTEDSAGAKQSGMIYGKDHAYMLTAPKGWVFDGKSGAGQGLAAVFYPEKSSWANGAAVMYANVWFKDNPGQTVKEVIENDIAGFKKNSPGLKIEDAQSIDLAKGKTATVKLFSNDANGNFEAIGYIEEEKLVVLIVLTSRTKKDFDASVAAFRELVGSYMWLTDKVTIAK